MSRRRLVARNLSRDTTLADQLEDGASFWARFMGLMGRASLQPGQGLWLPGEDGIHMLFMRFPLDIVFVSPPGDGPAGGRRVLSARRGVLPWRGVVWRVAGAKGVLELPAGTIEATRTVVGDQIAIEPA
ncbi:MAG: DUF192 domain-containing protein [Candidatus Limnocylindrales bacterium]